MTKIEFMEKLKKGIAHFPLEEQDSIIEYYEEYFLEAGAENAEQAISELEDPEQIIQKLKSDLSKKENEEKETKKKWPIWLWILFIFAAPFLFVFVAVAFVLLISIFIIIFSLFIVGIALFICGFFCFIIGIWTTFLHVPTGAMLIGLSFLALGLGVLFGIAMSNLGKWGSKLVKQGIDSLARRFHR